MVIKKECHVLIKWKPIQFKLTPQNCHAYFALLKIDWHLSYRAVEEVEGYEIEELEGYEVEEVEGEEEWIQEEEWKVEEDEDEEEQEGEEDDDEDEEKEEREG